MSQHVSPTYYESWLFWKKNKHMRKKREDKCTCMWKVPFQRTRAWRVPKREQALFFSHNEAQHHISTRKFNTFQDMIQKHQKKLQHVLFSRPWQTAPSVCPRSGKHLRKTNLNSWCVPSVCLNRCMENSMCQYLFRVLEPKSGRPSIAVAFWWFWIKIWRAWKSAVFQTSSTRAACLLGCVCVWLADCLCGLAANETYPFKHKLNKRNHHHKMILKTQAPEFDNSFLIVRNFVKFLNLRTNHATWTDGSRPWSGSKRSKKKWTISNTRNILVCVLFCHWALLSESWTDFKHAKAATWIQSDKQITTSNDKAMSGWVIRTTFRALSFRRCLSTRRKAEHLHPDTGSRPHHGPSSKSSTPSWNKMFL